MLSFYSYRVCELLYEQRHEYDKILQCYLRDPLRKPQVFSYLRNILLLYNNTAERTKVETQVIDNIQVSDMLWILFRCIFSFETIQMQKRKSS